MADPRVREVQLAAERTMRPPRPGIYWVKDSFWIDRMAGQTESEWHIAQFSLDFAGRGSWDFIGDECGLGEDHIVRISPEVLPPEAP